MWNKLERRLTALLLFFIVVLVFVAAVMRTFGYPVIWSVDFAQLLFAWLAVLGANQALKQGTHAKLDVLINKLNFANKLKLTLVLNLGCIISLLVSVVYGIELVGLNPKRTLGSTDLSYAWVTSALPVGAGLMALTLGIQCRDLLLCLQSPADYFSRPELPEHIKHLALESRYLTEEGSA